MTALVPERAVAGTTIGFGMDLLLKQYGGYHDEKAEMGVDAFPIYNKIDYGLHMVVVVVVVVAAAAADDDDDGGGYTKKK